MKWSDWPNRPQTSDQTRSTLHIKKLAHGAINYLTNIFNLSISTGQIPGIWHKAIIIPILIPGKDNIGKNSLLCPTAKSLEKLLLPKIVTHIPFHPAQHGFHRNTRQALYYRRSLPSLLPAFKEKWRLTEQYSSRSIWELHSTMWTINNCSIMSTMPTYRQQSVAGFTTICRTDEPKFIFGNKILKAVRWKQEWYKEEFCHQRSSITIWPTFQHRLRTSSWSCTPMSLPSTHPDQWWLT